MNPLVSKYTDWYSEPESESIDVLVSHGMKTLQNLGWSKEQAAGIMGNLYHESGGTLNPAIQEGGVTPGTGGFGIAQWTGKRRKALEDFARGYGTTINDRQMQFAFLNHELQGSENKAGEAIKATSTVEDATKITSEQFLRPGKPGMENRLTQARKMYEGDGGNPLISKHLIPVSEQPEVEQRVEVAGGSVSSVSDNPLINKHLIRPDENDLIAKHTTGETPLDSVPVKPTMFSLPEDVLYKKMIEGVQSQPKPLLDKTTTEIRQSMENLPEQVVGSLGKIIDLPHKYLTKPFIVNPVDKLLAKTGLPSTIPMTGEDLGRMGAGEVGGLMPVEDHSALTPKMREFLEADKMYDVPLRSLFSEGLGFAADPLVYSKVLAGLGALGRFAMTRGKLYKPVKGGIASEVVSDIAPHEADLARMLGVQPQELTGMGETLLPEAVSTLKKPYIEAKTMLDTRVAQGTSGELPTDVLRSLITKERPTPPAVFDDRLKRAMFAEGRIGMATETGVVDAAKKMYSGGPETEDILNLVKSAQVKGGTWTAAINDVAKLLGSSPEAVFKSLQIATQTSAGSMGAKPQQIVQRVANAFDTEAAPLVENLKALNFKEQLPHLKDVGLNFPELPKLPYSINITESTLPKGDLKKIKGELLSPSVVSRNLWEGTGPIIDWFKSWHKTLFLQPYYRRFLNNVFTDAGLMDDVAASVKVGEELIGPLSKRAEDVVQQYETAQALLKQQREALSKYAKGSTQAEETQLKIAELEKVKYPGKELKPIHDELEQIILDLERKHANVRIQRAADGNKASMALLSPKEKEVTEKLQEFYQKWGGYLSDQGVPIIKGPYTHHVYHWAGYGTDEGMMAFANKLWWQKETTPSLLTFMSRDSNVNWFPFAYQGADAYVGAASRKLAYNDWYKKWTPAIAEWEATGYGETANWLKGFLKQNMSAKEATYTDSLVNGLVNFEYAHYLFGNLSPAILHAFKVAMTPAYWGFEAAGQGVKGYTSAMKSKMFGEVNPDLRAIEFYNLSPQLIQAIEQSPAWAGTFQPSFWQRLRGNPYLNYTRLTEHFDRGVNTLATIHAGEEVGATAKQINNAVMDSLIQLNFFGWDLPPYFGHHRLLTMFQGQVWKQAELKGQLVHDAIMGVTDPYGKSHWPKLARAAVVLGGMYYTGQLAGIDLGKHVGLHAPFTTEDSSGGHIPLLAIPPPIKFAAQAGSSALHGGGWEETLKSYLSYGGMPQKILQENIPSRFNTRAQWLANLPKTDWREEARGRTALQEIMKLRRGGLKAQARHAEDVTPYNYLRELIQTGD